LPEPEVLWDLVIIGAGMGGSALLSRFVGSGLKVLILERGDYLKTEAANWDTEEVIGNGRYESGEFWVDGDGRSFHPRTYYNVGGNSKFFGGTSFRLRKSDFLSHSFSEGKTVSWPIGYDDLEPWYDVAETAMWVHGEIGTDPTDPHGKPYPFPPLEHEPAIADLEIRLQREGLKPFPLPIAVDQGPGGRCRKGSPCDGFPCRVRAKGDGENAFLRPSLKNDENLVIQTGTYIQKLIHSKDGKTVNQAVGTGPDGPFSCRGKIFVLAAGTVNSAVILLRSKSDKYPNGLSNNTDLVGRNFMAHNNSVLMAISLFRKNPTQFQKTLAINDFYLPGNPEDVLATGNIQMRGKIKPENLRRYPSPIVRILRRFIAAHSLDFWVMSEDLPLNENRVEIHDNDEIRLTRTPTNMDTHRRLATVLKGILHRCGFPIVFVRKPRLEAVQHQCGTIRFGTEPETSVLDTDCRSRELANLYVCDASVFPSSAAVNPALTVAANALRVGDSIRKELKGQQ
jgi:choline dehydrogenase-like flavoprotein